MGFQPRDVTEMMLAGHCMMFHEMMIAEVHANLCGEASDTKRTVIALNKAFNDNLDRLRRYRQRPDEGQRDASVPPGAEPPPAPVEHGERPMPAMMNRAARRQATRAETHAAAAGLRAASRPGGHLPPVADRVSV
jgi:hypothetical protein